MIFFSASTGTVAPKKTRTSAQKNFIVVIVEHTSEWGAWGTSTFALSNRADNASGSLTTKLKISTLRFRRRGGRIPEPRHLLLQSLGQRFHTILNVFHAQSLDICYRF